MIRLRGLSITVCVDLPQPGSVSDLSTLYEPSEMFKGAIVGGFGIIGEAAAGKLSHVQMIGNALTADALLGAGIIGAIASFHVFFLITLHRFLLFSQIFPRDECASSGGFVQVVQKFPKPRRVYQQYINEKNCRQRQEKDAQVHQ
jgi:hypothetical protein